MTKLATLFTDSYREFRHVKTITIAAMFGAISAVLGYFTIEIGSFIKIGFSTIANQFVYYLFGPVVGCAFGGSLDIIKYLVKPTGEFFPGFTLTAMVAGLLYGWFLYKRPISLKRVLAAELVVSIVCNMLMSTLWLSMLYGKGFMVLLPMRAVKNLIMWPINSMIFYTVAKTMEASGIFRTLKGYGN